VLFVNRKLSVAHNLDEQDMGDLKLDLLLDLGHHVPMRFIHILRCPVEEIKIDNRTLRGVARYQPAPAGGFFDVGHSLKDQSNRRTDLPGYAAWEFIRR